MMITILIKATDKNNLNDLIRSLINNAEKKENFQIFVGGDDSYREIVDSFKDKATIFLMKDCPLSIEINTQLVWVLADDVFILGREWDKRLLYYANKFPDDIIVMFPSGYKHYGSKSEEEVARMAERHPVLSGKWVELAGLNDAEMICRTLFLNHNIDRRVDIRLVDITQRGVPLAISDYDIIEVDRKADAIAKYIKDFTQGRG